MARYLIDFAASSEEVHLTPESSPELTKKSWFGSLMTTEKDETFTILVKGKPLATVKADLIHAFLSVRLRKSYEKKILFVTLPTFHSYFSKLLRLTACIQLCKNADEWLHISTCINIIIIIYLFSY